MNKCEICGQEVLPVEHPGNFYINVMNQRKDNKFKGKEPINLWFCSWDCIEEFITQEN